MHLWHKNKELRFAGRKDENEKQPGNETLMAVMMISLQFTFIYFVRSFQHKLLFVFSSQFFAEKFSLLIFLFRFLVSSCCCYCCRSFFLSWWKNNFLMEFVSLYFMNSTLENVDCEWQRNTHDPHKAIFFPLSFPSLIQQRIHKQYFFHIYKYFERREDAVRHCT